MSTYPIPESSIESGKYHTMRETYSSVREAHPDFYADSAVESTLSVRVTITHADGRVETLAAERPAAQRFTIACGYDAEGDTVSVYLTPAEGGAIPDAIVGNDLTTLDADTVFCLAGGRGLWSLRRVHREKKRLQLHCHSPAAGGACMRSL